MTGIVFVGVFLALIAGAIAVLLGSDRKRALQRGRSDRIGAGGASVPVVAFVPTDSALTIAQEAVRRVGGRQVEGLNGSLVVGWIGSSWTNVSKYSEYEMGVFLSGLADGSTQFVCSGRPRFGSQLSGATRSQELAQRLATEVSRLATGETAQ